MVGGGAKESEHQDGTVKWLAQGRSTPQSWWRRNQGGDGRQRQLGRGNWQRSEEEAGEGGWEEILEDQEKNQRGQGINLFKKDTYLNIISCIWEHMKRQHQLRLQPKFMKNCGNFMMLEPTCRLP